MRKLMGGVCILFITVQWARAAIVLSGTSYTENFNNISSGLPAGWSVYTGATASSLGTEASFSGTAVSWGETDAGFRNVASYNSGLLANATATMQSAALDRALGIRQTGAFGDPGAAFVLQIQNTAGYGNFTLSLEAQMLSVQSRSTTWTFDYRIGETGNFVTLGSYSDPGAFGSTLITFNSSQLSDWIDRSSTIYFRVVALNGSTGAGSRDTFGIDNFSLSYSAITPVPEPAQWGAVVGMGMLSLCGLRLYRRRRASESASR